MKPASAAPANGEVVETTIRKRTVPVEKQETPEFWAYFEAIKPEDWSPYRHKLFIYRYRGDEASSGPMDPLEKNESGVLALQNGDHIQLDNREDTEFAIAQKFGGGLFRLILKRGSERVTETRVHVDAPRKIFQPQVAPNSYESGPQVSTMGESSDVAHHALNVMATQEKTGFEVAGAALRTSAEVLSRFSHPLNPAPVSETDQLMKACMVRMLERAMNPPDPIEMLSKLLTLQAQLNPSGGGAGNPILNKVLDSAVEKLLNPAPSGPTSSAGAELVRQLPQVASYVTSAIAEWRAGTEAQRDTAAIMRGVQPPAATGRPAQPSATVLAPPPATNPASNGGSVGAPSLEFIESRIIKIFREGETAEDAAHETLEFLDTMDPQLIAQLKAQGESGLISLFHSRPVLKPATQNVPRLTEYIRAFLRFASEADAATEAGIKPN